MLLRKRLERLEAQHEGGTGFKPSIIIITEPGGEAMSALFMDGTSYSRHERESEAAFIARAECYASVHH